MQNPILGKRFETRSSDVVIPVYDNSGNCDRCFFTNRSMMCDRGNRLPVDCDKKDMSYIWIKYDPIIKR